MKNILLVVAVAWLTAVASGDPLERFWRENDGKTVRRLPVDVLPENAFWGFNTRDFPDGMKAFNRMVDEGYLRVGRQRYLAVMLHNLSGDEKRAFDAIAGGRALKTRVFGGNDGEAVKTYLQQAGAVRQPCVKGKTQAGYVYPEPDGTLRLIDGTAIRVRADWSHPRGLAISEMLESNGTKVSVMAEGLCAVRAEKGQVTALAAGGLTRAEGPGLVLALDRPEDVVLLKIGGEWRGIWQTPAADKPVPDHLAALTPHWIRLLLPPHLDASATR